MHSVLFVCTGNLCRSPMAMTIMRSLANDSWRIESAGTWAVNGQPASYNAELAMQELGLDLSQHQAQRVTRELLAGFSLVLVMERNHKEALRIEFPEFKNRIYLLSEMIDQYFDVADPYGSDLADYRATARELAGILKKGYAQIEDLSRDVPQELPGE